MSLSVDVVVITAGKWDLTERCMQHLRRQTVAHTVIVADNGSTDGTPQKLRAEFPEVTLLELGRNLGYSTASNRGAAAGIGEVIVLLNNDAFCRPDFLEQLLPSFEADERVGSVAPLAVRASDESVIDSVGLTVDVTLAGFIRLSGRPVSQALAACPLLSGAEGGANAYRRAAWEQVGGLDENLFVYGSELDIALRLAVAGWKATTAPDAVAAHMRAPTTGSGSSFSRQAGGWARGYLLRRYGILRSRLAIRALAAETIVVAGDCLLSRDTAALRGRLSGWRAARGLPTRPRPPPWVLDSRIGFLESFRLRWRSR